MGLVAWGVYQGLFYLCKINIIALLVAVGIASAVYFILIIKWKAVTEEELRSMPKGHILINIAQRTRIIKINNTRKSRKIEKAEKAKMENEDDFWLDE